MYSKIQITGIIEVITGMHIGGNGAFAVIGAIDSPVVKDVRTKLPMIPGSTLKGKIRTLLAKVYNTSVVNPDDDAECILRLFGSAKKDKVLPSRIIISDMFMSNADELRNKNIKSMTEVKFENSINRQTAVANPRQIERVIRGSKFALDIIYELSDETEAIKDIELLVQGMKLLQYDYIGANGSRGYGKIKFDDVYADVVVGNISDETLSKINGMLVSL